MESECEGGRANGKTTTTTMQVNKTEAVQVQGKNTTSLYHGDDGSFNHTLPRFNPSDLASASGLSGGACLLKYASSGSWYKYTTVIVLI